MLKTLKDEKGVIAIATTPFDDNNQIDGTTHSDYNQIKDNVHSKLRN